MMIKLKESTMKFVITSHVSYIQIIAKKINLELFLCGKSYCLFHRYWWFSPLHRKCTIDYEYSCQYSYEYLSTCPRVRVQVWVLSLWNSRVRVQYEYQKFSTRVLRVRVPSTSTPALNKTHQSTKGVDISWGVLWRRNSLRHEENGYFADDIF